MESRSHSSYLRSEEWHELIPDVKFLESSDDDGNNSGTRDDSFLHSSFAHAKHAAESASDEEDGEESGSKLTLEGHTLRSRAAQYEARLGRLMHDDEELSREEEKSKRKTATLLAEERVLRNAVRQAEKEVHYWEVLAEDSTRQMERAKDSLNRTRRLKRLYMREDNDLHALKCQAASKVREESMKAALARAKYEREQEEIRVETKIRELESLIAKRQDLERDVEHLKRQSRERQLSNDENAAAVSLAFKYFDSLGKQ